MVSRIAALRSEGAAAADISEVVHTWWPYLPETARVRVDAAIQREALGPIDLAAGLAAASATGTARTAKQAAAALRAVLPPEYAGLADEAAAERLDKLNDKDRSADPKTTLDHVVELAQSGDVELSLELLRQAGVPRDTQWGRCYGRTLYAIYTKHHPGEFARLVRALATKNEVVLASGHLVRWDPAQCPVETAPGNEINPVSSFVFGLLANNIRLRDLPNGWALSRTPHDHDLATPQYRSGLAHRGELANIESRLRGEPFVDVVPGTPADWAARLGILVRRHGPMLAAYRAGASAIHHGGSLAEVRGGTFYSLEQDGSMLAEPAAGLLYVVAPRDAALELGLDIVEYDANDPCGYAATAKA